MRHSGSSSPDSRHWCDCCVLERVSKVPDVVQLKEHNEQLLDGLFNTIVLPVLNHQFVSLRYW